jgi:hypothetical protein
MAMDAFGFKHQALAQVLGFCPSELPKVIAIETPEIGARIVAQSGRFTLHGSAGAFAHINGDEKYIRKLIVPVSAKPGTPMRLEWFGMQTWNLFPDLQSLATALKNHEFSSTPKST